jgi:ABC-type uncharacterized transport system ATPase subunit
VSGPFLELTNVVKAYGGIRPFRLEHLTVDEREQLAILGLDEPAAAVLVNLITGATLPEQGEVRVGGRATSSVTDAGEWLGLADRIGLVSERVVLLDAFSVIQNLALPFSVEIDPVSSGDRFKASEIAREVGIPEAEWDRPLSEVPVGTRFRIRIGRALAWRPELVILEHPSRGIEPDCVAAMARDVNVFVARRGIASLTLTADEAFAKVVASRVLRHEAGTGKLRSGGKIGWFGRRRT